MVFNQARLFWGMGMQMDANRVVPARDEFCLRAIGLSGGGIGRFARPSAAACPELLRQALEGGRPPAMTRQPRVVEAWLPFTVRVVTSDQDLLRVQALRALSYGRHLPGVGASFGKADAIDRLPDTTVLIAEDKHTGEVVGSLRIQTNLQESLQIEHSVDLPESLQGRLLAEITRLSVLPGYSGPVRLALVKACHLFCVGMQISGVMAGSRPSLLRLYRSLGFAPVFDDARLVPLRHAGGLPHHILVRDMVTAEAESRARGHADYPFVFRSYHPDISLFDAACGALAPRRFQAALAA